MNESPNGIEKPYIAFRLASTAISEGIDVRLFLMGDSVVSATTEQETTDGFYNMENMLSTLRKKGARLKACGTCINAQGLDISDFVEGVGRGFKRIFVDWIRDIDKVFSI